ncbi:MAG: hypothetical protein JKY92_03075, partial [Magnetovibrio sp.]|nr:hypothetical protein [Magnetovibrio sp.]
MLKSNHVCKPNHVLKPNHVCKKETLAVGIVQEIKARAGQVLGPVFGMTVVVYFAYHAIQGDRGFIALGKLRHDVAG